MSDARPAPGLLGLAGLLAAFAELAAAGVAVTLSGLGICPEVGGGLSCAAILRPRLASLGPLPIAHLAVIGALITLACAALLAFRPPPARPARWLAAVPAAGAGLALGLQPLAWIPSRSLCVICLGVLLAACLSAGLLAARARALEVELRPALVAVAGTLLLSAGLAVWGGTAIRAEDDARRAALATAGGDAGPQLLLVSRAGCAYCEALRLDVLGEPEQLALLARTRGLREVSEQDPLARAHAGGPGAPVLVALGAEGRFLARLRGYRPAAELRAWLHGVAARR